MSPLKQVVASVALLAAAAAGWYVYQHPRALGLGGEVTSGAAPGQRGGGNGGNRIPGLLGSGNAVNVITGVVEKDVGGEHVLALGTARALRSVTLYPQVTGVVADLQFRPGQPVEAGAILLRLDDDQEQVAADRARIAYGQARSSLERSQALAKSKTISSVALSDAEMAAQLAENDVRAAELAVARRLITAPFAGTVGLTDVSIGDLVTSSTAITTLEDLSTVRVVFEIPERWAGQVTEGQEITATAQGLPGSEFAGRITGIDNRVDETTRTLKLEAELTNPQRMLKAGMAISVAVQFLAAEQLAVPSLSVQWDRRGSYVWKVVDAVAHRANVAVVKRESGIVIVRGEVTAGDKIVVEGIQRLRDGAKVNEVDESPAIADEGAPRPDAAPAISGTGAPRLRS